MSGAPAHDPEEPRGEDGPDGPIERPLSRALVKVAGLSILPWTVGGLLSPFGEPHPAFLVIPPVALVVLIVAVRMRLPTRRPWLPWTFCVILVAASGIRFLVLPFISELSVGRGEMDGEAIRRVLLILGGIKLTFYLASAGLLAYGLTALARRRAGEEKARGTRSRGDAGAAR